MHGRGFEINLKDIVLIGDLAPQPGGTRKKEYDYLSEGARITV